MGYQQAEDWGSGSVRSFLRPPFMCAYGCSSSKAGRSRAAGPLAAGAACPECLSAGGPGDAEADDPPAPVPAAEEDEAEVAGDAGPPSSGVPGPCSGASSWEVAEEAVAAGGVAVAPADAAEGVGTAVGRWLDTGSRGMFSMFSTSMSSSSVSGGLFSSLKKKLISLKGPSRSAVMLLMISRKAGRILGLYCQHIRISSNLRAEINASVTDAPTRCFSGLSLMVL